MVSKACCALGVTLSVAVHVVPGLGQVTISTQLDDRLRFDLPNGGFHASRTVGPRGDLEIVVSGGGEPMALSVRYEGGDRLTVRRGATVVSGVSNLSALRALTDGRAVASFREHVGEFERRLVFDATSLGGDDPHGHGFLLAAGLVAMLAGDPVAAARARDLIMRRVSMRDDLPRRDEACLASYIERLAVAERGAKACFMVANADDSWYERSGQRLLCDAAFTAAVATYEVAFVGCRPPVGEASPVFWTPVFRRNGAVFERGGNWLAGP